MDALWMGSSFELPATTTAVTSTEGDDETAAELRRGPWTVDEDALLSSSVAELGEGRWNELSRAAGLRRTGKSCRLRWLNYLRPGVRRGDFTPREQLLVLELHARWGNSWSKIAAHMPGRTDNEVKNYWRTRVQKHARQLGCDVGSRRFHDVMRNHWVPRLVERIHVESVASESSEPSLPAAAAYQNAAASSNNCAKSRGAELCASPEASCVTAGPSSSETTSHGADQFQTSSPPIMAWTSTAEQCQYDGSGSGGDMLDGSWSELLARASSHDEADSTIIALQDFDDGLGETVDNFWSLDDVVCLQQLLC